MAEFIAVFLLYTCKAHWIWWVVFVMFIGLEAWAEYRKIMRTWSLKKAAEKKTWTGENNNE